MGKRPIRASCRVIGTKLVETLISLLPTLLSGEHTPEH